jgi:hypothetical protein
LIRPFIYAVADTGYYFKYAAAFLNSARANGHQAEVFCDGESAGEHNHGKYASWRYAMLPEMLAKHPAVLVLDVDTVIQRPFEIEEEYDLGVYLRPWKPTPKTKTMAGIFYCTDRAMEFAQTVAKAMAEPGPWWGRDQAILWNVHEEMGAKYRVKLLDSEHMDWTPGCKAPVYTRGRPKPEATAFAEASQNWSAHA